MKAKLYMRKGTFIIFFIMFLASVWSQDLPNKSKQGVPLALTTYPTYPIQFDPKDDAKDWWFVYSDRDDVNVYNTASGSQVIAKLDIMERMIVAELSNDMKRAHVFRFGEYSEAFSRRIPADAKRIGWVDLDQCLLSRYALKGNPKDDGGIGFVQKAIILPDTDPYTGEMKPIDFRNRPSSSVPPNDNHPTSFEPYYVLKVESDWVLLGKSDFVAESEIAARGQTLGWIQKESIERWNTRTVLEPNWEQVAVRAYPEGVEVYRDEATAAAAAAGGASGPAPMHRFELGERTSGEIMRSVVLQNKGDVSEIVMTLNANAGNQADIREAQRVISEQKSNVNIVIVIDGTRSMEPYFQPCINAVNRAMNAVKAQGSSIKYRFGAIIYRDYNDGDKVLEFLPLTNQLNEFSGFLSNVTCSSSRGDDIPESMFYGFVEGVEKLRMQNPNHTNLFIHIGDAGNQEDDGRRLEARDVTKVLSELDSHLLSFQINRGSDESYQNFGLQMQDVIEGLVDDSGHRAKWSEGSSEGQFVYSWDENQDLVLMKTLGLTLAKSVSTSPAVLENAIVDAVTGMDVKAQELLSYLEKQKSEGGNVSEAYLKWLRENFIRSGKSPREADQIIAEMRKNGGDRRERGWTTQRPGGKQVQGLVPVVYLSQSEFKDLMYELESIHELSIQSVDMRREPFQQILLRECLAATGVNLKTLTESAMAELGGTFLAKSINEIWMILFGYLPSDSGEFGNIKLEEITDPKDCPDMEFEAFFRRFAARYDAIRVYATSTYKPNKMVGQAPYYWIPASEMP